eukprot:Phypoly_transcript_03584.p1 GENE.Phypoly_transcript_03584~~Phypoly_transcript_03584.p1  ORF type:complete len:778 (+),score=119.29 Phypoly_transcript_03584:17-2350(+)
MGMMNHNNNNMFDKINRLTADINNWVASVQPSQEDLAHRHELYQLLFSLCSTNWTGGPFTLELFGSWKTNLLLPGSDIDVVIIDRQTFNPKNAMSALTKRLQYSNRFKSVFFVRNAKVPIIKVHSMHGDLTADISCNVTDGIDGSNFLMTSMQMLPSFRPIFLVVKKLLQDYEFNDASTGGLGSYALSVMLLTYLRWIQDTRVPLGAQLIGFLDYYGSQFQAKIYSVNFALLGGVVLRGGRYKNNDIIVDNPLVPDHNVAGACRKWYQISHLFCEASKVLSNLVPYDDLRNMGQPYKGDFTRFPMLAALASLRAPSAPKRIFNKVGQVVHKVVDMVTQRGKNEDDVIVVDDDDDDDDYDIVSHTEPKKRKRDDDDDKVNTAAKRLELYLDTPAKGQNTKKSATQSEAASSSSTTKPTPAKSTKQDQITNTPKSQKPNPPTKSEPITNKDQTTNNDQTTKKDQTTKNATSLQTSTSSTPPALPEFISLSSSSASSSQKIPSSSSSSSSASASSSTKSVPPSSFSLPKTPFQLQPNLQSRGILSPPPFPPSPISSPLPQSPHTSNLASPRPIIAHGAPKISANNLAPSPISTPFAPNPAHNLAPLPISTHSASNPWTPNPSHPKTSPWALNPSHSEIPPWAANQSHNLAPISIYSASNSTHSKIPPWAANQSHNLAPIRTHSTSHPTHSKIPPWASTPSHNLAPISTHPTSNPTHSKIPSWASTPPHNVAPHPISTYSASNPHFKNPPRASNPHSNFGFPHGASSNLPHNYSFRSTRYT